VAARGVSHGHNTRVPGTKSERRKLMSPANRGILPGLFLALVVAIGVLRADRSWLLPTVDAEGARYMEAASSLAAGREPVDPVASWRDPDAERSLRVRPLIPAVMVAFIHTRARTHAAGLWVIALSGALAVLCLSWAVGGAAGTLGALAAAGVLALNPTAAGLVTHLGSEGPLLAVSALLLVAMTYLPGWSLLHGALAALAWWIHPAGLGMVVASAVLPWLRPARTGREIWPGVVVALAPWVLMLLLVGGPTDALARPVPWVPAPGAWLAGLWAGVAEIGAWLFPFRLGAAEYVVAALLAVGVIVMLRVPIEDPEPVIIGEGARRLVLVPPARHLRRAVISVAIGGCLGGVWAMATAPATLPTGLPYFVPVSLAVAAAVGSTLGRLLAPTGSRIRAVALAAGLLAWMGAAGAAGWRTLADIQAHGRGFTADTMVDSEVLRWVDNRARPYAYLYSNQPDLVAFLGGRRSIRLPDDDADASADPAAFAEAFREHPGAIVLFRRPAEHSTSDGMRTPSAVAALGDSLRVMVSARDGEVLAPPGA